MIQLHDKETGAVIGQITEDQLQFLIDHLEEETQEDQDYYINQETLDMFETQGADGALLTLLRQAMGTNEDMEFYWKRPEDVSN